MRWTWLTVAAGCAIDESGLAPLDGGGIDAVADQHTSADAHADAPGDAQGGLDGVAADAPPPPPCNLAKPFGNFTNLGAGVNTIGIEISGVLSKDELTIWFARQTNVIYAALWYATRSSVTKPFGPAVIAGSISTGTGYDFSAWEIDPFATLYFTSVRGGDYHLHVWRAMGDGTTPDGWSAVAKDTVLSSSDPADDESIAYGSGEYWIASTRPGGAGGYDLWVSDGAAVPTNASALNGAMDEVQPVLSPDGLTIFFGRGTASSLTFSIWAATRSSLTSPFGSPAQLTEFGSSSNAPAWISADGCRLYFDSNRAGGQGSTDVWMATRGS